MRATRPNDGRIGALVAVLGLLAALRSSASVALLGPLAYDYVVQVGRSYEGSMELQNVSEEPQIARIYQNDYFFFADGKIIYGDAGKLPRSNARWITVSPSELRIPAGEKAVVRYTIQVPDDEALKGSYWSVVMVEPVAEEKADTSSGPSASTSLAVRQVLRYAVQISTQVGSTGETELRFAQLELVADAGKPSLLVDVENTGDRWYRAMLWAELYDADGRYVGKFEGGAYRMYPGTSARFQAELAGVPKGSYKALIVADCGGDDVFGINVNVVLRQ